MNPITIVMMILFLHFKSVTEPRVNGWSPSPKKLKSKLNKNKFNVKHNIFTITINFQVLKLQTLVKINIYIQNPQFPENFHMLTLSRK
jgi:hypothetical protein